MKNPLKYLREVHIPWEFWVVSLIAASLGLLGFYFYSAEVGALVFTAIFIAWYSSETSKLVKATKRQVMATEKYTRYSVMPNAFFTMKGNLFIVQNNSKFPIWFAVDIKLVGKDKDGNIVKEVEQKAYWSKPLFIYPGKLEAPTPLKIGEFKKIPNFTQNGKILAYIKYSYWPVFAPEERPQDIFDNSWSFDFTENKWTGPNGTKEDNIQLG